MDERTGKILRRILPVAVTILLIGVGVYFLRGSFPEIFEVLARTQSGMILLSLVALMFGTAAISVRLQTILSSVGAPAGFGASFYYVLAATFSSSFLRITGGAAIVTAVAASLDLKKPIQTCLVASFADRTLGMLAAPLLAAAGLVFAAGDADLTRNAVEYAAVCLLGIVVLLLLRFLIPGESELRRRIVGLLKRFKVEKSAESIVLLLRSPWTMIGSIALTAAAFLCYSLSAYFAGRALDLEVAFSTYLVLIPCLSVAMLIPSVGGLGVRETVFYFFLREQTSLQEALAVSLLYYAVSLILALFGGVAMGMRGLSKQRLEEEFDKEMGREEG